VRVTPPLYSVSYPQKRPPLPHPLQPVFSRTITSRHFSDVWLITKIVLFRNVQSLFLTVFQPIVYLRSNRPSSLHTFESISAFFPNDFLHWFRIGQPFGFSPCFVPTPPSALQAPPLISNPYPFHPPEPVYFPLLFSAPKFTFCVPLSINHDTGESSAYSPQPPLSYFT